MRTLVAGGAGFIGSHLSARLLDEGHEVVCLDNLSTGHARNVESLRSRSGFSYHQVDVVEPLPDLGRFDAVFNLASPASPLGYMRRPLETARVNSRGAENLLDLARASGARFLQASTSEVYGDPLEHPQKETYWGNVNPNGARACYDEGKRYAEMVTFVYWRSLGVDARIIRIFNTYGPHSDPNDGRIVPQFVSQALRGEPITVHGDGEQTRSFCYVFDLVDGIMRAQFSAGTTGEVFNLGNPDERRIREVAEIVNRFCGDRSEIVYEPQPRVDDPMRRQPDITKARTMLGWQPTVPLEEGLDRTIAWFRTRLGIPVG
ncbi:MAG TPA: UDP-glucuronic acid decarboxylase family protein [Chloroflexota bacterium]|jgi:nucleoside-diphosphate-sugar epimerase